MSVMAFRSLIYRRPGSPYWYGDFRSFAAEGGGREVLRHPDTQERVVDRATALQIADRRLKDLLSRRIQQGGPVAIPGRPTTLPALRLLGGLLDYHVRHNAEVRTAGELTNRRRYRAVILEFFPEKTPITAITRHMVKEFLVWLRERAVTLRGQRFSGSTRRHILAFLQQAFVHALDAELLDANPAGHIPADLRPRAVSKETRCYSRAEAGQILAALENRAVYPPHTPAYLLAQVAFALYTGARLNEVRAQRWEWIDWERGLIQIHTSKRLRGEARVQGATLQRIVPLWSEHRAILHAYWEACGAPTAGLLFPLHRPGTHPRQRAGDGVERGGRVRHALHTVLARSGVALRPRFQEFRVTYCAARLQTVDQVSGRSGEWVPVAHRTVELEMGHASEEMIKRIYGRVVWSDRERTPEVCYPR